MKANLLLFLALVLGHGTVFAESNNPSPAVVIPDGLQAVDISAAKLFRADVTIKAGDHVDIFATYSELQGTQNVMVTQMVMQNLLVLAGSSSSNNAGRSSMTVAVESEEANLVAAADRAGALSIALHPIDDQKTGVPSRPGEVVPPGPRIGDFWLPGEHQRMLEDKKLEREQKPN